MRERDRKIEILSAFFPLFSFVPQQGSHPSLHFHG
jgi:hypothetical protein